MKFKYYKAGIIYTLETWSIMGHTPPFDWDKSEEDFDLLIASIKGDVRDALYALKTAKTIEDEIEAVTWANHLTHVTVDRIAQCGLVSVFPELA